MSLHDIPASCNAENRGFATELIVRLETEGLLMDCVIGSASLDGVSFYWSRARLFCEVDAGVFYVSVVPCDPNASLADLKFDFYGHADIEHVVERIRCVLKGG